VEGQPKFVNKCPESCSCSVAWYAVHCSDPTQFRHIVNKTLNYGILEPKYISGEDSDRLSSYFM
jgi:hypothetical protein